jgi:hypothetical protein
LPFYYNYCVLYLIVRLSIDWELIFILVFLYNPYPQIVIKKLVSGDMWECTIIEEFNKIFTLVMIKIQPNHNCSFKSKLRVQLMIKKRRLRTSSATICSYQRSSKEVESFFSDRKREYSSSAFIYLSYAWFRQNEVFMIQNNS